jgi:hypothetical protein
MGAVTAPDGLKPISIDGQVYFVDDEAIAGLKDRGISYDDGSEHQSTAAGDFGRGAVHGATLGLADKQFGDSNQSVMQRVGGDDYSAVKERSPTATSLGDAAGTLAMPVAGPEGLAGKGLLNALGRAGVQAGVGAATGATRAYAEGEDPAEAGGWGAALGALGSGAADTVGKVGSVVAKYGSKAANTVADAARTRVFGIGGSDKQLEAIAQRFGVDKLPEKLAAMIEDIAPSKSVFGQNREAYRQQLEPVVADEGKKLGDLRELMGSTKKGGEGLDALIPQEWATMQQNLQNKLAGTSQRTAEGRALASALQADIEEFERLGAPKALTGVADVKSEYQSAGHTGPMGSIPDNASREASAIMGSEGKDTMSRLLDYATDDSRLAHEAANERYGVAATMLDQVKPKAIREQLNTNAAGLGSAALGTLGGAAAGAIMHPDSAARGAAEGGALGFGLSASSGTRNYVRQLLEQPRAMDALANLARASGKRLKDLDLNQLAKLVQMYTGKAGGYAAQND